MRIVLFLLIFIFLNIFINDPFKKGTHMDTYLYQFFAKDTKLFMADMLWLKVDQYHHADSDMSDILALSKLVYSLNPHHIGAILLYTHFLASRFDKVYESEKILKKAIKENKNTPLNDRLYAQLGMIQLFFEGNFKDAERNISMALKLYNDKKIRSSIFYPTNYIRLLYYIYSLEKNDISSSKYANIFERLSTKRLPSPETIRTDFKKIQNKARKRFSESVHQEMEEKEHHEHHGPEEKGINYSYHEIRPLPFQNIHWKIEVFYQLFSILIILFIMSIYERKNRKNT